MVARTTRRGPTRCERPTSTPPLPTTLCRGYYSVSVSVSVSAGASVSSAAHLVCLGCPSSTNLHVPLYSPAPLPLLLSVAAACPANSLKQSFFSLLGRTTIGSIASSADDAATGTDTDLWVVSTCASFTSLFCLVCALMASKSMHEIAVDTGKSRWVTIIGSLLLPTALAPCSPPLYFTLARSVHLVVPVCDRDRQSHGVNVGLHSYHPTS